MMSPSAYTEKRKRELRAPVGGRRINPELLAFHPVQGFLLSRPRCPNGSGLPFCHAQIVLRPVADGPLTVASPFFFGAV